MYDVGLSARGYRVVSVGSGREALSRARELAPDLIVLDIFLPDANGWEICTELRRLEPTRDIPIILLTAGYPEPVYEAKGMRMGADDFLRKGSCDWDVLLARIDRCIERNRGKRLCECGDPVCSGKWQDASVTAGELSLDSLQGVVRLGGREISFKRHGQGFDLLLFLAYHKGKPMSRPGIRRAVYWAQPDPTDAPSRDVDNLVKRVRDKLGDTEGTRIVTVVGKGYMVP